MLSIKNVTERKSKMSESYYVGMILTCVGGFLDAYTYFCRGKVFANAQTGNLVLLGIKIAHGNFLDALYYFIPIIAFVIGILFSECIKTKCNKFRKFHWRQIIVGFEILVLFFIAYIPDGKYNIIANVLVSFVCSLQVQSFRKIKGKTYASTMCTGNLRSGTEHLSNFLFREDKLDKTELFHALKYYTIIFIFLVGAGLGALITEMFGIRAIFFACGGLLVPFILMFK